MNLFVLGYGLSRKQCARVESALEKTVESYRSLRNGQRAKWQSPCGSVVMVCQYSEQEMLGQRRYVSETDRSIVIYDGLPVDGEDRFAAHDANELDRCWDESVESLDGFYCAARIQKSTLKMQLQLDSFGVCGVFYWSDGKAWLISNSIESLDRVIGNYSLDPDGVSRLLTMGWVAGSRTLREGIRAFPAGERWTWSPGNTSPSNKRTFDRRALAARAKSALSARQVEGLTRDLSMPLRVIGKYFANVYCPLTGGKDSRLLAALLATNGIAARYYTYGNREGHDSIIAARVANALGVDHETLLTETEALLAGWDENVESFVRRGDGMCPLQLIMGAVSARMVAAKPIPVRIWGAGGELGRALNFNPIQYVRGTTVKNVQDALTARWVSDSGGMMRSEAFGAARRFVHDSIGRYVDDGFRVGDLGDVFFLYERGARRAGKNLRATMSLRDSYSPFFSRSFVNAVFSLDPIARRTEPLHYRLIEELSPPLLEIPFDKGRWTSRSAYLNFCTELAQAIYSRLRHKVARKIPWVKAIEKRHILVGDTNFDRATWLKQTQGQLREMCLDNHNFQMWDYVDRDRFDRVTRQTPASDILSRNARGLFLAVTLYHYEAQGRALKVE